MEKLFKLFCVIVIIILLGTISFTSAEKKMLNDKESSSDINIAENNDLDENQTNVGTNVLKSYETEVVVDADQDGMMDSYGDETYSYKEAKSKFGMSYKLEIYDSSGNSKLDVGETTHAKLIIKNDSQKDYIVDQVRIDGKAEFFGENAFSNMKTENTGNAEYYYENNLLQSNGEAYKIISGSQATYEWDITWTNDKEGLAKKYLAENSNPYDFINIEFIAYTGSEDAIYYTMGNQQFELSGNVLK